MKNPSKPQQASPVRKNKQQYAGSAKVSRPQLASVYPRTRLFETLNSAREHHSIVWVSGPPGAGKSTLVNSYVEAGSGACLWYQIDGGDNDIASFFYYFEQAVQVALPRKRKSLPQLTPEHLPTIAIFARRYFEDVFARFPHGSIWVFDNYHELAADSPLHQVLLEGLAGLPPAVNVIVTSRNEPPPQLARLSVHNHLLLLDAQALKLTPEEAAGLAQKLVSKLPCADIQHINQQAGGWTAGVVLLISRKRLPSLPEQTVPLALFDYFAGEVFLHMEPKNQRILRLSALLPSMTPASVDQLGGEEGSAAVLADLARRSYFTVGNVLTINTMHCFVLFYCAKPQTFIRPNSSPYLDARPLCYWKARDESKRRLSCCAKRQHGMSWYG
jgi:LuxR family transcriptional regulator, maltose regulon positive regulatory protein